jgi:hypothetical protein
VKPLAPTERWTRREALAGVAAATTLALDPAVAAAGASGDAAIVSGLLRHERRLVALYEAALRRDLLEPDVARHLHAQERAHVRGLERALAGLGVASPSTAATPLPELPGRAGFPALALRLEDETVAAYVDALAGLRRPGLLQPLGSIAASDAQHQVVLRRLLGIDPLR